MIALDTSALVAMLLNERGANAFATVLRDHRHGLVGMPTALEVLMVATGQGGSSLEAEAWNVLNGPAIELVPFTAAHLDTARDAFRRFGRGSGHPARLNYGDCMSYAIARVASLPLLYKGDDFTHTDIVAAL